MSSVLANSSRTDTAPHHARTAAAAERQRTTYHYSFMGREICRDAFMTIILFSIGSTRLNRLQGLITSKSFFPGMHGNVSTQCLPC